VLRTEDRDLAAETGDPDPPVDPAHHADAAHAHQGGQDPERGGRGVEREKEVDRLGGAGHQEIADLKTEAADLPDKINLQADVRHHPPAVLTPVTVLNHRADVHLKTEGINEMTFDLVVARTIVSSFG